LDDGLQAGWAELAFQRRARIEVGHPPGARLVLVEVAVDLGDRRALGFPLVIGRVGRDGRVRIAVAVAVVPGVGEQAEHVEQLAALGV
jgi:hypothetical protein